MKHPRIATACDPIGASTETESREGSDEALSPLQAHLFVVFEADRPTAGGARFSLRDIDEVIVGRGDARSANRDTVAGRRRLIVRIPDRWLSSEHFRLVAGDPWIVEDVGSKNGTRLGESAVTRAEMRDGEVLRVGRTLLQLCVALPTPAASVQDLDATAMARWPGAVRTLFPETRRRLEALLRVAESTLPVVILGETGTGKELLARAVHERSGRRGPFVPVNCGALPGALVEGLLFGHVRGAFSNAVRDELGLIRAADGGTLFLDEIGDLPLPAQASLLRVLQEREVLPIGATRSVPVDLRVVSATHRSLDALVGQGHFRADLLARLDGHRHTILPVRDRRADIGLLVGSLLAKADVGERRVSFTGDAAYALVLYDWPGNVRELERALGRALVLHPGETIDATTLVPVRSAQVPCSSAAALDDAALRERLVDELARHQGNVSEVARAMGKARMQVQRWLRRFGLDASHYRKAL